VGELNETALDERTVLDPANRVHQFVFVNALGEKVRSPLNGDVDGDGLADGTDWDGDGEITDASGLMINVDTTGTSGRPPDCFNTALEVMTGYDDWFNMSLPFRQFGNLADAAVNPTVTPEPSLEEQIDLVTALNTTDLALQLSAASSHFEVGSDAVVTVATRNLGPNPAERVAITTSPVGTPLVLPPSCQADAVGVDCEFGPVPAGTIADLLLTIGGDNVCSGGLPTPIDINAVVENVSQFAGPDPDNLNNLANLTLEFVDTTAPTIDCNIPPSLAPAGAPITITPILTDLCDDAAIATITSVQCFRINPNGQRIALPCRVGIDGGSLTIRRTDGVGSQFEWTVEAQDASGNVAEELCGLTISHPGGG
jgi:hypothetical protein